MDLFASDTLADQSSDVGQRNPGAGEERLAGEDRGIANDAPTAMAEGAQPIDEPRLQAPRVDADTHIAVSGDQLVIVPAPGSSRGSVRLEQLPEVTFVSG